jgi:hypothetical protein
LETVLVERGAVVSLNRSNLIHAASFVQSPLHFMGTPEGSLRFQLRGCWFPIMNDRVGGCLQGARDETSRAGSPACISNSLLVMFGLVAPRPEEIRLHAEGRTADEITARYQRNA